MFLEQTKDGLLKAKIDFVNRFCMLQIYALSNCHKSFFLRGVNFTDTLNGCISFYKEIDFYLRFIWH